jgi:hypothetical protein
MSIPAKLEAVVILTTIKEIDDGRFNDFIINQLSNCYSTKLDLIIIINNSSHTTNILPIITNILEKFRTIETYYVEIPPEDDIYASFDKTRKYIPELGLSSGPNILFFSAIEFCEKYNTVLMLETDCILKEDCFRKLDKLVEYSGDFLIIGSSYAGNQKIHFDNTLFHHINGVALYKTGDEDFKTLIKNVKSYIIAKVKLYDKTVFSYDFSITDFLIKSLSNIVEPPKANGVKHKVETNDYEFFYWKHIYRKLLKTNLILDYSPVFDKDTTISDIENIYPQFAILHKKS